MAIKPPFSLILCCFLLASFLFFPHGTVSRRLLQEDEEGDNGPSKAGIRGSQTHSAPSWAGQNSPPASQSWVGAVVDSAMRSAAQREAQRGVYKRNCQTNYYYQYSQTYSQTYCHP